MNIHGLRPASKKNLALDTPRPPLVPTERNNAVPSARRPRTREVSSRYMSPTPVQRRFPSPNLTRTSATASQLVSKRAQSAERKRPSTPRRPKSPSTPQRRPISPSTPVHGASVDMQLSSKRISARLPDGLWPSTMRSLNISFQSESASTPISKKEKPVCKSDRTLRASSDVAYKHFETPTVLRKPTPERKMSQPTPERKMSPLKGKNVSNQLENSEPVDSIPTRLIDQHRWPSRMGGKVSSNGLTKSLNLADKMDRTSVPPGLCMNVTKLRRMPTTDGMIKPLQKSAIDTAKLLSFQESGRLGSKPKSVDDSILWKSDIQKLLPSISTERSTSINSATRSQSLPTTGLRPQSPSKTPRPPSPTRTSRPPSPNKSLAQSSISRGISPSRLRPSTPPSRAVSMSRIRISNTSSQSDSSTSVLRFIADIRKGKKDASYIDDAHQLRLMHNRYLQWRFANAHAEHLLCVQRERAERTLYNVWATILELRESVSRKMINLQQLSLELKLNLFLNDQMPYLDDWASLERDHISSLSGAAEDLAASTLRLPVTGGARSNIETLKAAICSAVDVMQAMGTSICPLLSGVEETNHLVSKLAIIAGQEKFMLKECESLLSTATALQVEEQSLRTHLIQMKQAVQNGQHLPVLEIKTPP